MSDILPIFLDKVSLVLEIDNLVGASLFSISSLLVLTELPY